MAARDKNSEINQWWYAAETKANHLAGMRVTLLKLHVAFGFKAHLTTITANSK
jgi:hypothetical protein